VLALTEFLPILRLPLHGFFAPLKRHPADLLKSPGGLLSCGFSRKSLPFPVSFPTFSEIIRNSFQQQELRSAISRRLTILRNTFTRSNREVLPHIRRKRFLLSGLQRA
jgi:hypothetical protein